MDEDDIGSDEDPDVYLRPDPDTIRMVPWYDDPTAQVIHDAFNADDTPVEHSSRYVLKQVLELYDDKGWRPIVAPELEFYLVSVNTDPDLPLLPPIGRSGRPETGSQAYGIDAVNEFDPIFEDVYDFCEKSEIDVDTLTHESGSAQMEINFNHGNPLELADQAFLFKRTVRQAAMKHNVYATFMAKPLAQPAGQLHAHPPVGAWTSAPASNLFADSKGRDTALFRNHVAGLQRYLPQVMPMLAPNVNSYRRLRPRFDAPINVQWGIDNRSCGLRVPISTASAPADREPPGRRRRQPLSRDRRLAGLRLYRHDRAAEADRTRSRAAPIAWRTPCRRPRTKPWPSSWPASRSRRCSARSS